MFCIPWWDEQGQTGCTITCSFENNFVYCCKLLCVLVSATLAVCSVPLKQTLSLADVQELISGVRRQIEGEGGPGACCLCAFLLGSDEEEEEVECVQEVGDPP